MAKLIPKQPGADRELLFDGAGKRNVVFDRGEHGDFWVIVMPCADKSLRGHLDERGGTLPLAECIQIMMDIAVALAELDGEVVHRDLKPENVLLLEGTWCLADFGLARYKEAATATHTWKQAGTVAYIAPERWRMERATIASDVYALGTMGYEMFTGITPFTGPEVSDFQRQHLSETMPRLSAAPAPFAALIGECLYRAPQARPTPGNIVARLESMVRVPLAGGLAALAQANHSEVTRQAGVQQQQSQERTEQERRKDLAEAAENSLTLIAGTVLDTLKSAASAGVAAPGPQDGWVFTLGQVRLAMSVMKPVASKNWAGGTGPAPVRRHRLRHDVAAPALGSPRLPGAQPLPVVLRRANRRPVRLVRDGLHEQPPPRRRAHDRAVRPLAGGGRRCCCPPGDGCEAARMAVHPAGDRRPGRVHQPVGEPARGRCEQAAHLSQPHARAQPAGEPPLTAPGSPAEQHLDLSAVLSPRAAAAPGPGGLRGADLVGVVADLHPAVFPGDILRCGDTPPREEVPGTDR